MEPTRKALSSRATRWRPAPREPLPAWVERAALAAEMLLFFCIGAALVGGGLLLIGLRTAFAGGVLWKLFILLGALLGGMGGVGWMSIYHYSQLRRHPVLRRCMAVLLYLHSFLGTGVLVHVLLMPTAKFLSHALHVQRGWRPGDVLAAEIALSCLFAFFFGTLVFAGLWRFLVSNRYRFDQPGAMVAVINSVRDS